MSSSNPISHRASGSPDAQWSRKQIIAIAVAVCLIILYIAFRSMGIQPVVMSDEQRFNTYSRLLSPAQANVPSYLFYFIYRLTNQCGAGFLECGRLLNILELGLGSILLYGICKQYLPRKISAYIAIITLLAPWGTYATYYMPEVLYYLIFLALTSITLNEQRYRNRLLFDCASGAIFGLLALVKPHALFLIPAYLAYRVYSHLLHSHARSWLQLAGSLVLTIGVLLLVRLGLGYLIAGHAALSLFGSMYGGVADKTSSPVDHQALANVYYVAKGHLYGLLVLFGLPLMAGFAIFTNKASEDNRQLKRIIALTTAVLACMLAITAFYTMQVNGMNSFESLNRLHMRYYFFLFPIFTLIGAIFCSRPEFRLQTWQKAIVAIVLVATLYAGFRGLNPYTPYTVDAPDLWSINYRRSALQVFTLLQALALLILIVRPIAASKLFLYFILPLFVIHSALTFPDFFSHYSAPNTADQAGIFYEMTIGDREPVAVIGDDDSVVTRTIFHLNAKDISKVLVPASQSLTSQQIAPDVRWIIALNDNPLDPSLRGDLSYALPGYKIWHVGTGSYDVDFSAPTWPGVDSIKGLSDAEPFGRWSDGKSVSVVFSKDIPANISVTIVASAFGPNVGQAVDVQVGDQVKQLKLGKDASSNTLSYQNVPDHTRSVIITVPQPISPKDLGLSPDPRKLGIGLGHLTIEPVTR